MKCYIINIEKRRDRIELMEYKFERIGEKLESVEEVNGREMQKIEMD